MILPDWLNATLASDAVEGRSILPIGLKPLAVDYVCSGPAFVILASHNDNRAVREAVKQDIPEGSVLVIAGHSNSTTASIGDLMALELKQRGFAAIITDGLVRDAQEICELGIPVWSRGVTAVASAKHNPGVIAEPVIIGTTLIRQGDLIIADSDGIVIWAQEDIEKLLIKAEAKLEKDNERLARLTAT